MASLLFLPVEVLEHVFSFLNMEDLPLVARVCKAFNRVICSEKVWKFGFYLRYPRLVQPSSLPGLMRMHQQCGSWRDTAAFRVSAGHDLATALDKMADRYHQLHGLPDPAMQDFRAVVPAHGMLFNRDALLDIIHPVRPYRTNHLSRRYYALMLYREMQRESVLLPMIGEFLQRPPHQVNLVEACFLVSQWMMPEQQPIVGCQVSCLYRQLSRLVLEQMQKRHPDHPVSAWTLSQCQWPPLCVTLWNDADTLLLLDVINQVMYKRLLLLKYGPEHGADLALYIQLMGPHWHFYISNVQHPTSFKCMYVSVAGMLGVKVYYVQPYTEPMVGFYTSDSDEITLIDVLRSGDRMPLAEGAQQLHLEPELLRPVNADELLREVVYRLGYLVTSGIIGSVGLADLRAVRTLSHWTDNNCQLDVHVLDGVYELTAHLRPMYARRLLQIFLADQGPDPPAGVRLEVQASLDDLEDRFKVLLTSVTPDDSEQTDPVYGVLPVEDAPLQQFDIGEVVVIRGFAQGVVFACDPVYNFPGEWATSPSHLYYGTEQAFYRILRDDHRFDYVAEEDLERPTFPRSISHRELGRFFSHFAGDRYVPLPSLDHRLRPRAARTSAVSGAARRPPTAGQHGQAVRHQAVRHQHWMPPPPVGQPRRGGQSPPWAMLLRLDGSAWLGAWPEIHAEEVHREMAFLAKDDADVGVPFE